MEKVIELEHPIKRPNTALIIIKDLYQVSKFVLVAGAVFIGVDFAKGQYAQGIEYYHAQREAYISEAVAESLNGKTFDFDDKRGVAKMATEMSKDELLRAIYLLERERRDAEQVINFVRETVSFDYEKNMLQ